MYLVTGIIQTRINGDWSEQPARLLVAASSRQAAPDVALAVYADMAKEQDAYAITRWHTPELVRVEVR